MTETIYQCVRCGEALADSAAISIPAPGGPRVPRRMHLDCAMRERQEAADAEAVRKARLHGAAEDLLAELKLLLPIAEKGVRAGCVGDDGEPDDELADHAVRHHFRLQSARAAVARAEGGLAPMTCATVRDILTRPPSDASRAEVWAVFLHSRTCAECRAAAKAAAGPGPMTEADVRMAREIIADPELGGTL